jgi:hypothetical protein
MAGMRMALRVVIAGLALASASGVSAQSFEARPLIVPVTYPTSLQFGPDDRLYVSEQYGKLWAFTVARASDGSYAATATEAISHIGAIGNHDDDGGPCTAQCTQRQVTGLLVTGTREQPVLLVTSSDSRIAVASDSNLDTNSGRLTRLTCTGGVSSGQCQAWERVDLVRGLPRSEENHATNGIALDASTNTLYLASGGNANKGAPSNSFSGLPEYYLSAAILAIDLDALAAIETANGGPFTDARDGSRFVYDLPTLDDPTRTNIDKTHPEFPYGAGHPWRERSVDLGDPFGGNDGYNQAFPEPGGPVRVQSPGQRNAYDVLVTQAGRVFTWDNGPNAGWGGTPPLYTASGAFKGYSTQDGVTFDAAAGDTCTNELNEGGSGTVSDALHDITTPGTYGGHPAPIRAFPASAGIYNYEQEPGGHWVHTGPVYSFADRLPAGFGATIADFQNDPRQCDYTVPAAGLETINASTNGLAEYTADNFNGGLRGDLLAASFNGNLYRCKPDGAGGLIDLPGSGSGTAQGKCEVLLGGFGAQPLDVTTQGDADVFPGTIWAATYGASSIVVFEPVDFACDPSVPTGDADGDGYSNGDESANGTNACSAGSRPDDFDADLLSDLTDPNDDNDATPDIDDVFALDASNGTALSLPVFLPLFNNDPGTGLFGLGFTGLMLPRNGTTTWRDSFNPELLAAGGAVGLLTTEQVSAGTAQGAANSQDNGFLFGVDAHTATPPFAVTARLRAPWFEVDGTAGTPQSGQHYGVFLGTGDQDNYVSLVLAGDNGGAAVLQLTLEVNGAPTTTTFTSTAWGGSNLLAATALDLSMVVDPQAGTVQPRVTFISGGTPFVLGSPVAIPVAWLSAADARGLAVGAISTRGASGVSFGATWDAFSVDFVAGTAPGAWTRIDDFPATRHEGGFVQAGTRLFAIGGREGDSVLRWDPADGAWSTGASSPVKLHHFQAVELDGLIYAIGAMTGECCSEPPAANVYIYDPVADRWITGPAIPSARRRGGGGAVAVGGKIYLVSGNTNGHNGPVSALVDVFDPAAGTFTALAPIPNPRDHFFAVHHEGRLFVAGGRVSDAAVDGNVVDDTVTAVDVYDIATNTWTTLPAASNLPTPRAGAATGIVGNELIVAGGESAAIAAAHAQVEAMDLDTAQWRTLTPMRTPRHAAQALVSNHGFYVAGGSSQRGGAMGPLELEALHLFGATPPAGTAVVASTWQATPAVNFGRVAVGATRTQPTTVTLANGGNQAILVSGVSVDSGSVFRLIDPPSVPVVIAPGASLTLTIEFAPAVQGPLSGLLTISSPGRADHTVALAGEGFGSVNAQVLYRINVGGPQIAALDAPAMAWAADTLAAPSAFRIEGGAEQFDDAQGGAYGGTINVTDPSLPANVPAAVFQSERWDPIPAPEMRWAFPVAAGSLVEVRLFFAELYAGTDNPGERVFDVKVEGRVPMEFNDIDRFAQAGAKGAIVRAALVTTSGPTLDLEFIHGFDNPALNAIEVRAISAGVNTAPVARDDFASVATGGSVSIPVLGNDSDSDGTLDPATVVVMQAPAAGTLQVGSGTIIYTQGGSSATSDRFTYAVRDDRGELSNSAVVLVRRDVPALSADVDGDGTPNPSDVDDDNDGIPDTSDAFALDATNGRGTDLPITLEFVPQPGAGLFGVGFTGLMTNGVSDYATAYDPARVFLRAGEPRFTLATIDEGTAAANTNTQTHAFQFGVNVATSDEPFVVRAQMVAPFFDSRPQSGQSQGVQIGRGTQDSYLALLLDAGTMQLQLHREDNGQSTALPINVAGLATAQRIDLMLLVDPASGLARPMIAIDGAAPIAMGEASPLPLGWLAGNDAQGLAVGLIGTSAGAAPAFAAHWQLLEVNWLATDDVFDVGSSQGAQVFSVQANDAPAPGRRIATLGTPDRGGSVVLQDNGTPTNYADDTVRYTPAANSTGIETFTYTITTTLGSTASAVVAVGLGQGSAIFRNGFEE